MAREMALYVMKINISTNVMLPLILHYIPLKFTKNNLKTEKVQYSLIGRFIDFDSKWNKHLCLPV